MAGIPPSGAPSASSTSKLTSSTMHSTHTREPSESIHTSLRCGSTWAACTRAATTRSLMPSTPYARAAELDPGNHVVSQRLQLFKNAQATGSQLPATPGPQDVHPNAYANPSAPPPGLSGPPLLLQSTSTRFLHRSESNYRGPGNNDNIHLPLPPVPVSHSSPSPHFRGPPPPVSIDESWHLPSHTPLAPMDVDLHHQRDFSGPVREKCWSWPDRWPSMSFAAPPRPSTAAPDGGVAFFRQPRTTAALGVLQPSTTRVLGLYFACLSPHSPSLPWLELLRVCPSRSSANWSGSAKHSCFPAVAASVFTRATVSN
ncbi:hypothetical protein EDD15DRAFT_2487258 [Pisolithus albus]|nr:hypothetical protein EDD15DRAFT_2487258 [Pisolithus albus]